MPKIKTIVKVTKAQMVSLEAGQTIAGHTYDPQHCLYMVDDGLEMPTSNGSFVLYTDDEGETFSYEPLDLTHYLETKKHSYTGVNATTDDYAGGSCFFMNLYQDDHDSEASNWSIHYIVKCYSPDNVDYNAIYDIVITGGLYVINSYKIHGSQRDVSTMPMKYNVIHVPGDGSWDNGEPIKVGVGLDGSTRPRFMRTGNVTRNIDVTVLECTNCHVEFLDDIEHYEDLDSEIYDEYESTTGNEGGSSFYLTMEGAGSGSWEWPVVDEESNVDYYGQSYADVNFGVHDQFIGYNSGGEMLPIIDSNGSVFGDPEAWFDYHSPISFVAVEHPADETLKTNVRLYGVVHISNTFIANVYDADGVNPELENIYAENYIYFQCEKNGRLMRVVGVTKTLPSTEDGYYYIAIARPIRDYSDEYEQDWMLRDIKPIYYYRAGALHVLGDNDEIPEIKRYI